jgi:hypothetical protein
MRPPADSWLTTFFNRPRRRGDLTGPTCIGPSIPGRHPLNDTQLPEARLAVRRAAHRLISDAPALSAGSARAYQIGLAIRLADLRHAVSVAWRAGVSVKDIAQDSGLKVTTIDEWIAMDYLRRTPTMISHAKHCPS